MPSDAMTTLRATAIMKTDISGSTARFRSLPEADLHRLLLEHREFLTRHAAAHDGGIVKPEGDGFWVTFPSVTAAALAAMAMQEELRLAQANAGDNRLAMRVVLTLGDVLHEEGALVGDAVVLATRIEAITPPDEIYLSAAAWLAVNRAEVRTALVDTFTLKGFDEPVAVYRVEQTHRTRVIEDQYIVWADLRGFSRLIDTSPLTAVEGVLDALFEVTARVSRECGGTVRFSAGDAYCLTFDDVSRALAAAEQLSERWGASGRHEADHCGVNVAIHQGTLFAFRSFFYGRAVDIAAGLPHASAAVLSPGEGGIFLTGSVRRHLAGTRWDARVEQLDPGVLPARYAEIEIYRLGKPGNNTA